MKTGIITRTAGEFSRLKSLAVYVFPVFVTAFVYLLSPAWSATSESPTAYRILFVGDTSFGENYQAEYEEQGQGNILKDKGYDYPLARLKPMLVRSDLVIANLETPITDMPASPFAQSKYYIHWTDVIKAPRHLRSHNIEVVSLANNHSHDFGEQGLRQTLDVLHDSGMTAFGAGLNEQEAARPVFRNLKVGRHSVKLAVIAAFSYHFRDDWKYACYAREDRPGSYALSLDKIGPQIARLKAADPETYVVIYPHWGVNYAWRNNTQAQMAHGLIDAGADLIIGHGAHAMQEIEQYKDRWIIYSTGNFMFNSSGRYKKMGVDPFSLAAELTLSEKDGQLSKSIRLYPLFTDNLITGFQSRPVSDQEFQKVVQLLLTRSPGAEKLKESVGLGKDELGSYLEL